MEDQETHEEEPQGDSKSEGGVTKVRSGTSYPYYGLATAITVVEAVRAAGGNEASYTDVMREMKVSKPTDRLWAYGIPAAIQFGLIERVGRGEDGRIKLTELAVRIALPGNADEARAAKVAAFKQPELYAKLLEKFAGHPVPLKEGLKNILHRDFKIVESMAPIAADAFIESLKTAELVSATNAIFAADGSAPVEEKPKLGAGSPQAGASGSAPGMQTIAVPADFIVYRCKIGKGRVIEIPLPPAFSKTDVDRLHAFLETQIDDDPVTPG